MAQEKDSCVQPAAGPLLPEDTRGDDQSRQLEASQMVMARVGGEAPDFETTAYIAGTGFKNVKLSDYRGKWVLLCFYPGDFTFV
jgi:hypothetical protein